MMAADRILRGMSGECVRHRPALLDLLEDPTGAQLTAPARTHLDTCATCRQSSPIWS